MQTGTLMSLWRGFWTRLVLHGVHYRDSYSRLDALYRLHDPWNMEDEAERFRFVQTNLLIESQFGHVGSILEIGCGEGHQSRELLRVCDSLYGIDVSPRAIARAKERCPQGRFAIGDMFQCKLLSEVPRFDLVLACEVMYYMRDIPAAIARCSQIGRACLVTYYQSQLAGLDPYFRAVPGAHNSSMSHGSKIWHTVMWSNGSGEQGKASDNNDYN